MKRFLQTFQAPMCLWALVACMATQTFAAEKPEPGEQVAQATTVEVAADDAVKQVELRYWLYLPPQYKADGEKWPLLLFLHGAGERGDDLELVKKHGPPKQIAAGEELPFIVVAPQCPKDFRWNAAELAKLVDQVANTHRVDKNRLYVTGLSMGGSGTWSLLSEYPDLFAAAVPICGRGEVSSAEKIARTPVWVFVGDKDKPETVQNCRDMAAALRKAGSKQAELTVYPGVPHDSWTQTYNNPKVYEWLLKQRR